MSVRQITLYGVADKGVKYLFGFPSVAPADGNTVAVIHLEIVGIHCVHSLHIYKKALVALNEHTAVQISQNGQRLFIGLILFSRFVVNYRLLQTALQVQHFICREYNRSIPLTKGEVFP